MKAFDAFRLIGYSVVAFVGIVVSLANNSPEGALVFAALIGFPLLMHSLGLTKEAKNAKRRRKKEE